MTRLSTTIGEIVRGDREVFPPYLYAAYQSTRRRAPTMPLVQIPLTLSELTGPGPAVSAVVQVAALFEEGAEVEIEATAVVPRE